MTGCPYSYGNTDLDQGKTFMLFSLDPLAENLVF